jgi:hypothetical protein
MVSGQAVGPLSHASYSLGTGDSLSGLKRAGTTQPPANAEINACSHTYAPPIVCVANAGTVSRLQLSPTFSLLFVSSIE